MHNKDILRKIVGVEGPIGSTQWNPPKSSVSVARNLLIDLEDKRVLFNPMQMEDSHHCVQSVNDIRNILTGYLKEVKYQT